MHSLGDKGLGGAEEHGSHWAAIGSVAAKIGCTAETLRRWVRQAARRGPGAGLVTGTSPGGARRRRSVDLRLPRRRPALQDVEVAALVRPPHARSEEHTSEL